jgi:dihydrofolate reductase
MVSNSAPRFRRIAEAASLKEKPMSSTVLYMSMSLDGFVAGPNETWDENPLGDDGGYLHGWFPAGVVPGDASSKDRSDRINSQIFDELNATGAVVAGAGTFEPAAGWGGDHHGGVPIFIYSRHEPRIDISGFPRVTYVDNVETAMAAAKQAAGDKDVLVHGAAVAQLALAAGVLDELELQVVPVLLGDGRRLFEGLGSRQIELDRIRVLEGERGVTHLRYRVRYPA